jgi:hypothetical protein
MYFIKEHLEFEKEEAIPDTVLSACSAYSVHAFASCCESAFTALKDTMIVAEIQQVALYYRTDQKQ